MAFRTVLLTSVLMVGALASGCGGMTDGGTTPTSPSSLDGAGPSQGATRPPQPPRPEPPPWSGTCADSGARWAIGQPASEELLERARVDTGAQIARFIRPNQPITTEYSSARLNLYLNGHDIVQSVVCG
jgi:hypothetical protein